LNISPEEALYATLAAESYALMQGIQIVRVHDVKAAKQTIQIIEKIKNTGNK
jgi:dihydropteroate synthase